MKRFGLILVGLAVIMFLAGICYAGEKEELLLKRDLYSERIARIQAQYQILQEEFKKTQEELKIINEKLKLIENQEKKKEEPKK